MPGKRFWLMATLVTLLAGTGCCRLCDRWCGTTTRAVPVASQACVPCCPPAPVCCPVPQCPPGTVPATSHGGQWQRGPYSCP